MQRAGVVKAMKPADIINFLFFPVVNEGCRVIAEGIVDKPSDLDVASVMAMGFPAVYGGLVFWADTVGAAKICAVLDGWAAALPEVAGFFKPCELLRRCAASGKRIGDTMESADGRSKL
jgi:enoyl-CoA hydratase/3-hydroxyacyl-CoA dehydrogenase